MSTNTEPQRSGETHDPTQRAGVANADAVANNKYLELDKKLGAAEYALAADIAAGNEALGAAMDTSRRQTRSAIGEIRRGRSKGRS